MSFALSAIERRKVVPKIETQEIKNYNNFTSLKSKLKRKLLTKKT